MKVQVKHLNSSTHTLVIIATAVDNYMNSQSGKLFQSLKFDPERVLGDYSAKLSKLQLSLHQVIKLTNPLKDLVLNHLGEIKSPLRDKLIEWDGIMTEDLVVEILNMLDLHKLDYKIKSYDDNIAIFLSEIPDYFTDELRIRLGDRSYGEVRLVTKSACLNIYPIHHNDEILRII